MNEDKSFQLMKFMTEISRIFLSNQTEIPPKHNCNHDQKHAKLNG